MRFVVVRKLFQLGKRTNKTFELDFNLRSYCCPLIFYYIFLCYCKTNLVARNGDFNLKKKDKKDVRAYKNKGTPNSDFKLRSYRCHFIINGKKRIVVVRKLFQIVKKDKQDIRQSSLTST